MSAILEKARDLDNLLATAVQDDAEAGLPRAEAGLGVVASPGTSRDNDGRQLRRV